MIIGENIREDLKKFLEENRLSYSDFSVFSNISKGTISNILNGKKASYGTLIKIYNVIAPECIDLQNINVDAELYEYLSDKNITIEDFSKISGISKMTLYAIIDKRVIAARNTAIKIHSIIHGHPYRNKEHASKDVSYDLEKCFNTITDKKIKLTFDGKLIDKKSQIKVREVIGIINDLLKSENMK